MSLRIAHSCVIKSGNIYIMGDSLEENFVIGDSFSDTEEVQFGQIGTLETEDVSEDSGSDESVSSSSVNEEVKPKKKRNWREAALAGPCEPEGQCELLRETFNFKRTLPIDEDRFVEMGLVPSAFLQVSDSVDREPSNLTKASKTLKDIFDSLPNQKSPSVLLVCASASRVGAVGAELAPYRPLSLQLHGTGRKKEQFNQMAKDIASGKGRLSVSVPARITKLADEGAFPLESIKVVVVDMKKDDKGINILSNNDTRASVCELIEKLSTRLRQGLTHIVLY